MAFIDVQRLEKTFIIRKREEGLLGAFKGLFHRQIERRQAVAGITFSLDEGEIVGVIGPNGAGKSTTIKCMTGILVPSGGRVLVGGIVPWEQRRLNARQIGVVFGQKTALWWDVPVIETFKLLRDIYMVPEDQFRRNMALFDDILGMREFLTMPVRQLSLGQRMRADLAAALLHNPRVLFLDEPTIGLDVSVKERLRGLIREINKRQRVTVLLTTHDVGDLQQLAQRILVIDHGRLIYQGTIEEAIRQFAPESTVTVELSAPPAEPLALPHGEVVRQEGLRWWIRFRRDRISAADLVGHLIARYPIRDFTLTEPDIEEIIRGIYDRRYEMPESLVV